MPRPNEPLRGATVVLLLAQVLGCSGPKPQSVEVGHHRVLLVVPKGWEHLDHGRQQLFRLGEAQISLEDLGPVTHEAMVVELRVAEELWRAGRKKDAFQIVRQLRSTALRDASQQRRANFWKPWTDATYAPESADSGAIGGAFEALIAGVQTLPEVTPQRTLVYVRTLASDTLRTEIARQESRTIHGSEWVDLELWNRVSHLGRARLAYTVNGGYLLVLSTDRGLYEQTKPAFEALLTRIEVIARSSAAP